MKKLEITTGTLFIETMNMKFQITHICPDHEAANSVLSVTPETAMIAEDNAGRIYLALVKGYKKSNLPIKRGPTFSGWPSN